MTLDTLRGKDYPKIWQILLPYSRYEGGNTSLIDVISSLVDDFEIRQCCHKLIQGLSLSKAEKTHALELGNFENWLEKNVSRILFSKIELYDRKYKFKDEVDFVVELKDHTIALLDLHASVAYYPKSSQLQIAAYKQLADVNHLHVDTILTVLLNENKVETMQYNNAREYWQAFQACIRVYSYYFSKK